jgi:hypothetical protein
MAIIDPFAPQKRAESNIIDPFAPKATTRIIDPFAQKPTNDTVNPFADQKATEPPVEQSNLWEFPKGIVRGGINLQNIPAGLQQRYYALGMEVPDTALSAFDKIDAGELKSKKDINKFLGVRRDLAEDITSTLELEKGRKGPGETLRSIDLAKDYLNASPDDRKKLRDETQAELQEKSKGFGEAVAYSERIKKQAEPYAPRVDKFTSAIQGGVGDLGSYAASTLGEAIPQMVPVIASGVVAKKPGLLGTSIGMELGPATQDRVDYITKQVQNEPDPEKRAAAIAQYVRDTKDVTLTAATVSGLFDAVLGPEADIAKRMLSGELRQQTRKEILKAIPKVAGKSGAQEFLTGGLQETVMINAERMLGEQTGDAFTKENIFRVVDSAMAEAIGGFGMSTTIEGARALGAKKNIAETNTPEGQAVRDLDALAGREETAGTTTQTTPPAATARTLDSLTEQEVSGIQRQLYAELGRPANEQELMGAFNNYIEEQNTNAGIESEANVTGGSDVGFGFEDAGVSDTGTADLTPEEVKVDTDVAALEQEERTRFDEVKSLVGQQQSLLTKAGRIPAKNSPARKKWDALEEQITEARSNWNESDTALRDARKTEPSNLVEEQEVQAIKGVTNIKEAEAEADRLFDEDLATAWNNLQNAPEERREQYQQQYDEVSKKWEEASNRVNELREAKNAPSKPVFALPESYAHGTDYLTSQKIIREGRLVPNAGKRMYSYSQFGRKAVYLTDRSGWWLDSERAANGRAVPYDASVPFKLDPKANIREVNSKAELDAIAREIGEENSGAMMRKLDVEDLDYEQTAREVKGFSFSQFIKREVKRRREQLKKYEEPGADTVVDIASWAAQDAKERPEFAQSEQELLEMLKSQYDFLQSYESRYKEADEVTKKLLAAGIDGIYIGPNFEIVNENEYKEFNKVLDKFQQDMPDAAPQEVYAAATEEYKKTNPTYFDRVDNNVASDQLALFRPELAIVDRARLAATKPGKPALASDTAGDFGQQPGETIEQYRERLITGPNSRLDPNIVELIRNNDLNGALNAVAAKFSVGKQIRGFYGDLATRLAELNLPTEIRIGDQRNLTRRSIDQTTSGQQVRLFSYLRTNQPYFFDKYFKDYYKDDALELVYNGLLDLQQFNVQTAVGPVINEYYAVLKAYETNMPAMYALGAYYSNFDAINLNEQTGLSYHTFLHEVVHAATEILLQTPEDQRTPEQNAAIEELQKLYKVAKDNIKVNEYGLTNLSEFIAEVYTNQRFRNRLKGIPYAPAKTNMLTRFIQTVMKLVGMDNVAGRAMVEAEKLFNTARPYNLVSAGPRFAQGKKRGRRVRGPITTPSSYRDAESQQGSILQTMKDAYNGRMEWKDAIKIIGPALWDSKNTLMRQVTLPVLNLTHLEDLTRTKFTQLTGALAIIRDMIAYRTKKLNVASQITADWVKLQNKDFAQSQLMGRIMMEATIRGIDPDTAQPGTLNAELQKAWGTLKPEYKKIYRDVRNFYSDSVTQMVREMKRRASAIQDPVARAQLIKKIDEQFGPDKLVKPYFPLRRFGQHWFQVGSGNFKEFYEFENPVSRDVAMRRRARELSKGNAKQKQLAETLRKGNGLSELYGRNIGTTQVLKDVQELVDGVSATDVADLKGQLQDSLNQLVYILLPQQSMRKMFINRKAIQGASSDMLRVFATTAVHSAYQQSRFMYSEKFLQNLNNARGEIDGAEKAGMLNTDQAAMHRDFINEVEKRVPTIMSNEDKSFAAQVAGKASEITFYYMLSAPFTAILNTIGAVQLAMPYIGGSYGYLKANTLLVKNLGKYLGTVPKRVFSPIKNGTIAEINFPSIVEGANLSPLLRRAADRFIDNGQIDISITNDIMNLGDRPSELYTGIGATVKKTISGLFHQSERMNREILLMTTFELAYDKFLNDYQRQPGMEGLRGVYLRDAQGNKIKNTPAQAFELAIEDATRIAALTLGDFSRQMKGRVFANPAGMVLLKFKQYPILAMYALARNLDYAVRPYNKEELDQYKSMLENELKNATDKAQIIEQRMEEVQAQQKALGKEARRRLAGILGMTAVLGGQAAMPYFSLVIGTLVKMFAGDDEDDYFDWENWFYNYMETEFGGYLGAMLANAGVKPETAEKVGRTTGEIVSRGVPAAMGMALSDRVSLDPKALLWRDGRYSPDARENFIESVIANSGPVVGLGMKGIDAYQLAKEGQYERAAEAALPAIVSKPLSAVRMGKEGARTKSGDVILDDFTATELAMQAIGLQPERLAQKQKVAIAMKQKEQKILDERSAIMNRLWLERDNDDGFDTALERASEFSIKHPGKAITIKNIKESFKKRTTRAAEAEAFGADIDKKLRGELSGMGEFAEDED